MTSLERFTISSLCVFILLLLPSRNSCTCHVSHMVRIGILFRFFTASCDMISSVLKEYVISLDAFTSRVTFFSLSLFYFSFFVFAVIIHYV